MLVSDPGCNVETVVIEVTEACNHACRHCYNFWRGPGSRSPQKGQLSRNQIHDLVRKIKNDAPLKQVAISGGEPFLRDDLPEIVGDLALEDLSTVVITNGSLLTDDRLGRFPEGCVFEVTLFSADSELHDLMAGRKAFDKVLEGLVRVERHRCKFVLACVVTKLNAHDTARTIELGIALGADAVLLNRVNLSRSALKLADQLVPSASQIRQSLDAAEEASERYGIQVAVSVPVPPCVVDLTPYSRLQFGWCPRGGKDAYYTIGPKGYLRPCNHSSVILGDLNQQSFAELVLGDQAREFWAPVPQICLECTHPLGPLCRGGCPAASDECYGSRLREDPIIEFACGH